VQSSSQILTTNKPTPSLVLRLFNIFDNQEGNILITIYYEFLGSYERLLETDVVKIESRVSGLIHIVLI